jgi:hypothetical protein
MAVAVAIGFPLLLASDSRDASEAKRPVAIGTHVIDAQGETAMVYAKTHLFGPYEEEHFQPGRCASLLKPFGLPPHAMLFGGSCSRARTDWGWDGAPMRPRCACAPQAR